MNNTDTLSALPRNTPLMITVNGRVVDRPLQIPRHAGLIAQMGTFEWCEWPEMKAHTSETDNE